MAAAGAVLGLGGWAWACTPQARVVAASAESAPAGSTVAVRGEAVRASGAVELRWDGVRGPVIGSAVADAGGRFSAEGMIPDAAPGVHTIVIVGQDKSLGRLPFEVTPSSAATTRDGGIFWPSAQPWESGSPRSDGPGFALGAAMLGLGAAGLSAGAAAAVVARRRELAGATTAR